MRLQVGSALCLLTVGCVWLNAPDDDLLDLPPSAMERFCDDGEDNEGDGLSDCADFDCIGSTVCCDEPPSTPVDQGWAGSNPFSSWTALPSTNPQLPTVGDDGDRTVITAFASVDTPSAIAFDPCIPMTLGIDLEIELKALGTPACEPDKPCPPYAAVVLTLEPDMEEGQQLRDELAILLYGGGLLRLTRNTTEEIARTPFPAREWVTAHVTIVPLVGEGEPVLRARITAEAAGEQVVVSDDLRLTGLDRLINTGDCSQVPGLNLAIEGQGSAVLVGQVRASRQTCVNPSQFQPLDATLMSENLGFDGSAEPWTVGSFGAPTLASSRIGGRLQWDLLVEASDLPPETPVRVGHAIGHARTTTAGGQGPAQWGAWESSIDPKAGDLPPSCIGDGCPMLTSVREPHVLARSSSELILSFAQELPDAPPGPLRFGLQVIASAGPPDAVVTLPNGLRLIPGDLPSSAGCVSLRDPSLIPVNSDASEGYWLLFTCVPESGTVTEVQAVKLDEDLALEEGADGLVHRVVLDASAFGAVEIRSPEPVVVHSDRGATIRLWSILASSTGARSVGLAVGFAIDEDLVQSFPPLVPFPINPVIESDSPSLGPCLEGEECTLQSLAVTPRADDPSRLRFLLARRVKQTDGGRRYELVPVDQVWKIP